MTPLPPDETPNPYAAPASHEASEIPSLTRSGGVRFPSVWAYAYGAVALCAVIADVAQYDRRWSALGGGMERLVGLMIGLSWLEAQWGRLPPRIRRVKGVAVTPGQAAWRNLIPFFGLYWMFAVNASLCAAINNLLVRSRSERAAPVWLARACPMAFVVASLTSFAGRRTHLVVSAGCAAAWLTYILLCERALTEATTEA